MDILKTFGIGLIAAIALVASILGILSVCILYGHYVLAIVGFLILVGVSYELGDAIQKSDLWRNK